MYFLSEIRQSRKSVRLNIQLTTSNVENKKEANSPITKKFSGCTKKYPKTGFAQFRCPLHPPQADGFAAVPIRAKFGFGAERNFYYRAHPNFSHKFIMLKAPDGKDVSIPAI